MDNYATEVLLGNHAAAVLLDFIIYPQDPESPGFRSLFIDKVLNAHRESAWKAAMCIEGVLITHGGISSQYERVLNEECQGDPMLLAEHLNLAFLAAVRRELETGQWDEYGILGEDGPMWFRPQPYSHLLPLAEIRQVVGHTPASRELEACDFHMVDPCAFLGMEDPGRFRYAVIEVGRVRVEEGTLGRVADLDRMGNLAEALLARSASRTFSVRHAV